ncbi:glycosyltransferase family 4 protein [Aromatoleum toluclasticum]|uniref:glycosyltransferase family 4 protein n=1 Tax=Aromatoleum toluclasticum TaxID=92003 RepID=UPI0012FAE167|nr:glycosyltransferase family 1 protein [Aromatoleum toluclasticum]
MSIWLDVTTTLGWRRPALGIVRVEAETARHFLNSGTSDVRFCHFDAEAGSYLEVPYGDIRTALERLDTGASPAPTQAISPDPRTPQSMLTLPRGCVQPFNAGDVYVSLGLDWDQKDLEFLYELKQRLKLKVLLFCYDIIPILLPTYCVSGVAEKFPRYFVDAAWCADKILCISNCSRRDLTEFLETVGAPVPALDIVRLGNNIRPHPDAPPSTAVGELGEQRFILFVSTIEGRKNHEILCRAYKRLQEQGAEDLPLLVFVGMQGWGVETLMELLRGDAQVRSYVRILDHVSDSDLVYLYRKCMFTVYPSLYEGWGLPVAESLAHGKFCLASSAASIPEVGGGLIEYVEPLDDAAWAARLLWYLQNPEVVATRESEIVRRYRDTSWQQTGAAVLSAAQGLTMSSALL